MCECAPEIRRKCFETTFRCKKRETTAKQRERKKAVASKRLLMEFTPSNWMLLSYKYEEMCSFRRKYLLKNGSRRICLHYLSYSPSSSFFHSPEMYPIAKFVVRKQSRRKSEFSYNYSMANMKRQLKWNRREEDKKKKRIKKTTQNWKWPSIVEAEAKPAARSGCAWQWQWINSNCKFKWLSFNLILSLTLAVFAKILTYSDRKLAEIFECRCCCAWLCHLYLWRWNYMKRKILSEKSKMLFVWLTISCGTNFSRLKRILVNDFSNKLPLNVIQLRN